jgi:hypothetical protein
MGVSFKMRKRRETGKNSASGGQRLLRFSILKETPTAPIFIPGQAQKSMPAGALHLLGLPGEDYEAKGAVQREGLKPFPYESRDR